MSENAPATASLSERYPKHIGIPILIILSGLLLIGGLAMPLMNVEKMVFWQNDYSVVTGIVGLFQQKEYFLGLILIFFCLIFPVVKITTLWILWVSDFDERTRNNVLEWLGLLGKWSMLDVFVVAILIVAVKLGPMASVTPKIGVYIFCLAIISSLGTTTWIERTIHNDRRNKSTTGSS